MLSCKCGNKDFHKFYEHKAKNMKRLRCLNCNRTYEIKDGERKEIDLNKSFDDLVKSGEKLKLALGLTDEEVYEILKR